MSTQTDPVLIQGGMGVAVSSWRLARAVSSLGHLGVVSGTALDVVLARRLQRGDPDGEIRRAIAHFPNPAIARDVLARYFIPGGHNAPPRGSLTLNAGGEPIYGPRDTVDLARMRDLGLPFWLAGSRATPGGLLDAQRQGAAGIQVGTLFAFCDESGVEPSLRMRVLETVRGGAGLVHTDPLASPTGFPFKVVQVGGTLSEPAVYAARERRCDLGYLRELYRRADGTVGYRCPAEPIDDYVRKGGRVEDTVGRKCICNGLAATVGLGQQRRGAAEPPIVTAGTGLHDVGPFLHDAATYSAAAVVAYLTGPTSGR